MKTRWWMPIRGVVVRVRWKAVPANILEPERALQQIMLATGGTLTLKRSGKWRRILVRLTLDQFIFWPKLPPNPEFCIKNLKKFSEGDTQDPLSGRGRPPPASTPNTATRRARGRKLPRCWDSGLWNHSPEIKIYHYTVMPIRLSVHHSVHLASPTNMFVSLFHLTFFSDIFFSDFRVKCPFGSLPDIFVSIVAHLFLDISIRQSILTVICYLSLAYIRLDIEQFNFILFLEVPSNISMWSFIWRLRKTSKNISYICQFAQKPHWQIFSTVGPAAWLLDVVTCEKFLVTCWDVKIVRGSKHVISHWQVQAPIWHYRGSACSDRLGFVKITDLRLTNSYVCHRLADVIFRPSA